MVSLGYPTGPDIQSPLLKTTVDSTVWKLTKILCRGNGASASYRGCVLEWLSNAPSKQVLDIQADWPWMKGTCLGFMTLPPEQIRAGTVPPETLDPGTRTA